MNRLLHRISNVMRLKWGPEQFVQDYDAFLQKCFVTTSSLQNIIDGKLDKKRRIQQLLLFLPMLYTIPRYVFICSLYLRDRETRLYWQYYLADYMEQLGVLGRLLNVFYVLFTVAAISDKMLLRKAEATSSLQFLTDLLNLASTSNNDVNQQNQMKLLSRMNVEFRITRVVLRSVILCFMCYDTIGLVVFIYKMSPSLPVLILAMSHYCVMLMLIKAVAEHFFCLYLSYIITTDYIKARIKSIMAQIRDLEESMSNSSINNILSSCNDLMMLFKRYNHTLKHLLRNYVYFYCLGLAGVLSLVPIEMHPILKIITLTASVGATLGFMMTGFYFAQLHTQTMELYNQLNSLSAKLAVMNPRFVNLKTRFRLRLMMKELGNKQVDGQFVIGLTDGSGAATSRYEIYELTATTIENTLMVLGFIHA